MKTFSFPEGVFKMVFIVFFILNSPLVKTEYLYNYT